MTPIEDYKKVMNIFSFLQGNKLLQNNKHVPGYENLLKRYNGSEEAQILDAAFFLYAIRNYEKALTILEQLKCKDINEKALFFRIYATLYAKPKSLQSISKALILVNKILELNPKNSDAKILKIRLKMKQKEYSAKTKS